MTDTMNPVNQTQTKRESLSSDDFIMSPMVDVCFVNLMRNPIVRKGFCAAVLRIPPDMINETEFLPSVSFRHFRRRDPRTLVFRGVLRSLCVVRTDLV